MNEDNQSPPTDQDNSSVNNQASIDFIEGFLGDLANHAWVAASTAPRKLEPGGFYDRDRISNMAEAQRHHVSAAIYRLGATTNTSDNIVAVPFIVIDDVGPRGPNNTILITSPNAKVDIAVFDHLPPVSWKMETSAGNFQYGYHFNPPLEPQEAKALHAVLKANPAIGPGLHAIGQYLRLPTGTNSKADRGNFKTKITHVGGSYTIEEFTRRLGVDLNHARVSATSGVSGEAASTELVQEILKLIPNDSAFDAREDWVRVAHAIFGALGEDGRELWLEWSYARKNQTLGVPDKVWDTLPQSKASASTLRKLVEERYGADSDEYKDIAEKLRSWQAKQTFGVVEEAETQQAEAKLINDLLRQLRDARPIPPLYDPAITTPPPRRFDENFPRGKPRMVLPIVIGPLRRGRVAMLTAMPGAGKSTYGLLAAVAVAYEAPHLAGESNMVFPGDTVILSNEDEEDLIQAKMEAMEKHYQLDGKPKHGVTAYNNGWKLMTRKHDRIVPCCEQFLKELIKLRRDHDIAMIVIDTLSSVLTGLNENDNQEMQAVADFLEALARAAWCSVVVVHHLNKASLGKDGAGLLYGSRGASSIPAAFKIAMALSGPSDTERALFQWTKQEAMSWVKLERSKNNRGDPTLALPKWFKFVSVSLPATAPDGSLTTEDFGILEENTPLPGTTTFQGLQAHLDKITDIIWKGTKVYSLKTKSKNKVTVFDVLGLTPASAEEVMASLEGVGALAIDGRTKEVSIENVDALKIKAEFSEVQN